MAEHRRGSRRGGNTGRQGWLAAPRFSCGSPARPVSGGLAKGPPTEGQSVSCTAGAVRPRAWRDVTGTRVPMPSAAPRTPQSRGHWGEGSGQAKAEASTTVLRCGDSARRPLGAGDGRLCGVGAQGGRSERGDAGCVVGGRQVRGPEAWNPGDSPTRTGRGRKRNRDKLQGSRQPDLTRMVCVCVCAACMCARVCVHMCVCLWAHTCTCELAWCLDATKPWHLGDPSSPLGTSPGRSSAPSPQPPANSLRHGPPAPSPGDPTSDTRFWGFWRSLCCCRTRPTGDRGLSRPLRSALTAEAPSCPRPWPGPSVRRGRRALPVRVTLTRATGAHPAPVGDGVPMESGGT